MSDAHSDAEPEPAEPVDCVVCSRYDPKGRLVGGFMVHKRKSSYLKLERLKHKGHVKFVERR